jgi:hypothetical protein
MEHFMKSNLPTGAASDSEGHRMSWFEHLASRTAILSGKPVTFLLENLVVFIC